MSNDETKKCFECGKNMIQKDTAMALLSMPPQYPWIWWCFCGNTEEGGVRRGTSEADVNIEKWRQANQEDELEPGCETDKLVAEAIGVECELRGLGEDPVKMTAFVKPNTIWSKFSPSTDLNDAFWAAKRVDLFGCHERFLSGSEIWEWSDRKSGCANDLPTIDLILEADSPAMAICKAILKLKEPNDSDS